MAAASVNVLGIFSHADTTLRAIQGLREKGFSDLKVYTPVPVEEIEEEMESVRPLSKVRLFAVACCRRVSGWIDGYGAAIGVFHGRRLW